MSDKIVLCDNVNCRFFDEHGAWSCKNGMLKSDSDHELCNDFIPLSKNKENKNTALDVQVGGDHYKNMAIQPIEFTHKNGLNFCQGNIIKYATRYKSKNGIEDLRKVIHYAELLIQLEYGENK